MKSSASQKSVEEKETLRTPKNWGHASSFVNDPMDLQTKRARGAPLNPGMAWGINSYFQWS